MSLTNGRDKLILIAAIAAPIVLVQTARWFMAGAGTAAGPAPAAAATFASTLPEPAPVAKLTAQQDAALAFIRKQSHASLMIESSPMDFAAPTAKPVEPTPGPQTPVTSHTPATTNRPPPPEVLLTAIITGKNPLAVINGGVFKVGDEVETGWRIARIDAVKLTVELIGPGDTTFSVTQARSGD